MLKPIAQSLIVALITGLSALSYAAPHAYRSIVLYVVMVATLAMLLFWFWSWGAESKTDFKLPGASNPMLPAVKAFGLYFALVSYLGFLYLLPSILEATNTKTPTTSPTTQSQ